MKVALLIATMLATTVLVDSDAVGFRINHRNDKNTGPRSDLRCGSKYGNAICDPYGKYPCCSDWYHCGNTAAHCDCSGCVDYRRGKRGEDEKKEVLQDAAAVLKEVVQEAEKEAAMDLLERIASLDGSVAVPQDPAAEWEKKEKEAEEEAEEKLEEELEEELEELEEELKNKEGDE